MLRTYLSNANTYAYSEKGIVTVDEIIEFLEQHRGKEFWAGGDTPCFCANENTVLCDSGDYMLSEIENDDFLEPLEQFFCHGTACRPQVTDNDCRSLSSKGLTENCLQPQTSPCSGSYV